MRILIPPERSNVYQRPTTESLANKNKIAAQNKSTFLICLNAARISCQPSSRKSTAIKPTAKIVPTSCRIKCRFFDHHTDILLLLSQHGSNCIRGLALRLVIRARQQFSNQPHQNGLESQNQKRHTQLKER